MSGLFDVSGRTALVTGGSRGIGLMIARGLVQAGARVIVSSRKTEDIEAAGS
jgi:NAD(P)-dependent dehydrogenase (short-subunit alcohol dehydrogenase family)